MERLRKRVEKSQESVRRTINFDHGELDLDDVQSLKKNNKNQEDATVVLDNDLLLFYNSIEERLVYFDELTDKYFGGNLDLKKLTINSFKATFTKFFEEICEQAVLIYEMFKEEAYKQLIFYNILYSNPEVVLQILPNVQANIEKLLETLRTAAEELIEKHEKKTLII